MIRVGAMAAIQDAFDRTLNRLDARHGRFSEIAKDGGQEFLIGGSIVTPVSQMKLINSGIRLFRAAAYALPD